MQSAPDDDRVSGLGLRSRRASVPTMLLFAAVLVLPSAGCSMVGSVRNYLAYNDTQNDFVLGFRNGVWAQQAWAERRGCFEGQPQFSSFGAGFRAGYVSVASGGNGCPPAVAPRKYWTWKYQTPEGQAKVAAWFAGFPHGARAAEEEQAGEYQHIQVSYAIEHQYSPEFLSGTLPGQVEMPEIPRQDNLEPLPNPGFVPSSDDSASFPQFLPPGGAAPPNVQGPLHPGVIPVAYHQPVGPGPQPPPRSAWPQ